MEYEIVTLKEKIAVGIAARTNNLSPNPGAVIGGLWNRFYQEGIYAVSYTHLTLPTNREV